MKPTIKIRMNHKHCKIHFDFLESFPEIQNNKKGLIKTPTRIKHLWICTTLNRILRKVLNSLGTHKNFMTHMVSH